jgi:GNAT superfamily N-acetyltransferase
LQLTIDKIDSYIILTRPHLNIDDRKKAVERLTCDIESGTRDPKLTRLQCDEDGSIKSAVSLSPLGEDFYLLSPLFFANKQTNNKKASLALLSEIMETAKRAGLSNISGRVELDDLFPGYEARLTELGFKNVGQRIEFKSPVELLPGETGSPLDWTNMSTVSQEHVVSLLGLIARSAPDWEAEDDPAQALIDFFSSPHLSSGPDCVHIGKVGSREAALVIAQVDKRNGWSRLTYMGLIPEYQGKGLGAWVHRHGFHMLKDQGGQLYHGGCLMANKAMRKLFERHGCRECRRLSEWSWRAL